ncbi:MAG: hypothetical protein FJ148_24230 [Deltaproteobacteria bacterium]|nr:hypothetical protein [Deltaproteobacteria bacterium]
MQVLEGDLERAQGLRIGEARERSGDQRCAQQQRAAQWHWVGGPAGQRLDGLRACVRAENHQPVDEPVVQVGPQGREERREQQRPRRRAATEGVDDADHRDAAQNGEDLRAHVEVVHASRRRTER